MCGLCGELRFDGAQVDAGILTTMRDQLAHRGPDGAEMYLSPDRRVGLGFRRLAIIDLSPAAAQPMANEDGSVQLVFNGEVYNFRELRARLERNGHRFRSRADSEVILHLWEDRGEAAVDELDGMFAFAVWDARRGELVLARDRAGKKPLFYDLSPERVVFGSEIKALLAHPAVSADLDPAAIPHFFMHGYVPGPATIYRNIHQVPPATVMTFRAGGTVVPRRYWVMPCVSPEPDSAAPPRRGDGAREVRRLLTAAVEHRLVSDVPVGAFLSGGIDSTIAVGLMSRLTGARVKTFSIGFEGEPEYDETSYAREVAARFQSDHEEFRIGAPTDGLVDALIRHHDGPFGDASAIPTYVISQLARRDVTVVVTGDGGDEVFAGYRRFRAELLADRVPSPVGRVLATMLAALPAPAAERHWLAEAKRFAGALHLPLLERLTSWNAVFFDDLSDLVGRDVWDAAQVDRLGYLRSLLDHLQALPTLARLQHATFASYLPDDLLVKTDRCTMAHAVEARAPFLDTALVEYVARLPDGWKLQGSRTKVILREAFADLLPPSVARRPKMGFGVPLGSWFRGKLRSYLVDHLLDPAALYRDYLSADVVHRLVHGHLNRRLDAGRKLWALLCFERWLRIYPGWKRALAA